MRHRHTALVVILLVGVGVVLAAFASASGSVQATFRPGHGWIVASGGSGNPSLIVAVTTRDAAAVRPVALFGSFTKLSRRGILVWVETSGRGLPGFPTHVAWPPQLRRFRTDHGWEGQPAPNIQQRVWVGRVRGWDLDVRVFFATQHPSTRLQSLAQAELDRLRLF